MKGCLYIYGENLYIETLNGNIRIPRDIVESQGLEKGMLTPFTRFRIVGENGDFPQRQVRETKRPAERGFRSD